MKKEKMLYDYILNNGGQVITSYRELADIFNIPYSTIRYYRDRLVKNNEIISQSKVIDNRKRLVLSIPISLDEEEY